MQMKLTGIGKPPNLVRVPTSQYVPMKFAMVPESSPSLNAPPGVRFTIDQNSGTRTIHATMPKCGTMNVRGYKTPVSDARIMSLDLILDMVVKDTQVAMVVKEGYALLFLRDFPRGSKEGSGAVVFLSV